MSIVLEALKNLFSRPSTIEYPKKSTAIESDARGRHYADLKKCIGCSLCAIECPPRAITMKKLPEDKRPPRNRRGLYPVINYAACIFCYRCVTVCPVKAYIVTNEYRLAEKEPVTSEELTLHTLGEQ